MNSITIAWIALPLFLGFVIYLLPKLDKYLALFVALASAGYALQLFVTQSPLTLQLLDNFGVILTVDQLSGYFILTNALVTAAVILYCWHSDKTAFFLRTTDHFAWQYQCCVCLYGFDQFIRGVRGEWYCCVSVDCLSPD
jgi:multicomponent Na+:H+ antiporter subunit D